MIMKSENIEETMKIILKIQNKSPLATSYQKIWAHQLYSQINSFKNFSLENEN